MIIVYIYRKAIMVLIALLISCAMNEGEKAEDPSLPDPSRLQLRGECDMKDRLGSFVVHDLGDYAIAQGEAANAVLPMTIMTELTRLEGCRLMGKEDPFCEPQCAVDETCNFDGSCLAYPQNQNLGEIRIDGLNQKVVMTPRLPGNTYFDTELPYPAFEPGTSIRLTSTNGFLGELEMYGIGVEPLEIADESWRLTREENLIVKWNEPQENARSTVRLRLSVDQHGAAPVSLLCDLPDSGSASISADLIQELLDYGISGVPSASLTRQTVDSQQIRNQGCVEFVVGSPRKVNLVLSR